MSDCEVIRWESSEHEIGPAVVAIGVFDGVHLGHQAMVRDACAIARDRGARCVVVTFDRDPDIVLTPDSAAPQLLTLKEKTAFLAEAGADVVLVVRFCHKIAVLSPERFVTDVLLDALEPVTVVVGCDFRFGHQAAGTVDTLREISGARGFDVVARDLLEIEGAPVTSTRIRALIAQGDVQAAARLLGRPHRVHGPVVRGRGEGAGFGVATANVMPQPHAALPADGVYAGRVEVHGQPWPAAISVGRPPSFPDAHDVLEAHLIGYEGDLYHLEVAVEFFERLRDQRAFDTVEELVDSIREDIDAALAINRARDEEIGDTAERLADLADDPWVDDPAALEAAERAVATIDPADAYDSFDETWIRVWGPFSLGAGMGNAGARGFTMTGPLTAEGIPFAWDPFPPESQQNVRPDFNWVQRFSLFVPPGEADRATEILTRLGYTNLQGDD